MSDLIECDTIQIIEPKGDFLVDTAGSTSDMDERGEVALHAGQLHVVVYFRVPKLNPYFNFEYLYIDAMGNPHPGGVHVIPTVRANEGFAAVFAGSPVEAGYVLHWRVTIVRTSTLVQIDAPELLYLPMPRTSVMNVLFVNPRSNLNYGFTELRVENLSQEGGQAIIHVQVIVKTLIGVALGVNPVPRSDNYFLRVRTP